MAISIMILGILGLFFLNSKEDKALLYLKRFAVILPLLFVDYDIIAQHYVSNGSGGWTTSSTWTSNSSPSLSGSAGRMSDSVTISAGHTVTLTSNLELQSGSVLLIYGQLTLSGNVTFKNGCYVKVFNGGTLQSTNGIQSNNSTDIYVDGTLTCDGDYTAGTGSSISGSGSFEVSGTLTNSGTIMGSTTSCSDCNIETGAISESNAIVDGSTQGMDALMDCYYRYNYSQQIYLQSEIGSSCTITKVYFKWDGYTSTSENWVIYLGNTSKSAFSSSSDWISTSNMTQVFSGSVSYPSSAGWVEITLDTEFAYDDNYNLVVAVDENTYSYPGSSADFYSASVSTYRNLMYDSDGTNPNPNSPPTYGAGRQKYVPSFKIFSKTITPPVWTAGASTTDWHTASNWNIGAVPTTNTDVTISSTSFNPVITSTANVKNITVNSGAQLTVSGSGSLSVSGDLDVSGTLSYSSSGDITLSSSSGTLSGTGSQTGVDYVIASGGSYTLNDSWSIDNMNVNSGGSLDVATTKTLTTATDLTNGGTLTCSGSANLTVGGDVSLTGTTTMGSGTLDLDGDYTNSGTFTSGTSTFKMSGTSQQTINNTNVSVSYTGAGTPTDVLTEGFEGGSLPSGWSQEYVSSTNAWDYEDGAGYTTPGSAYSGSYNAVLFASRGSSTKLITPAINLGSHTSATLTFYHAQTNWGGDQDELRIYYKTSSGGSWTLISGAEWTSEVSSWTQRTVSLPNINSTYYIAFEGYSDYGHGVCIDEIVVSATPNAAGPLSLSNEFYNVIIDNSNGINLSTADIGYSNNLTLTSGVITTGTDDTVYVESTSSSALPNGSSTSFINGNVKFNIGSNTNTYSIPLGDGTASSDYYRVDLVNNNLVGVDCITARMVTGSPNGYDATSLLACDDSSTQAGITSFKLKQMASETHLKLTPNSQPTGGTYGLNFYTANFDKSTWTSNKVAIFKRSEGSSDNCAWSVAGTLPADDATGRNVGDDYLSFTGANSFSEFGPGGEGGGLLPVTLSNFDATLNDGVVNIVWTTQTEIDNDYFTVERTQDAIEYEDVTEVLGAGNSIVRIDYSATDEEPLYGTSYYRLKQVDYDGTFNYSDIVAIENNYTNLSNFNVYYDGQNIQIRYELDNVVNYSVMVYDISGKLVYNGILNGYVGNNSEVIPFNKSLVSGVYSINIIDGNQVFSKNILIN